MKIYLSGAISKLSEAEYKSRFFVAQEAMQELGYQVVNPCLLSHEGNIHWADFMLTDIKALFECGAIYMLNNWKDSKGARIEHAIAVETGMKIFYQP
jgi:hypothetical protein